MKTGILPDDLSEHISRRLAEAGFSANRAISSEVSRKLLLRPADLALTVWRSARHKGACGRVMTAKEENAYVEEFLILENVLIGNGTTFLITGLLFFLFAWLSGLSGLYAVGTLFALLWSLIAFRRYIFGYGQGMAA